MRGIPIALLACLLSTACDKDEEKAIECIDPVDGQTITEADDLTELLLEIQIEVTCTVRGFDPGDPLTLNVQDDITGTDRNSTSPYDGTGSITFLPVTLHAGLVDNPGQYTLVASGDDGDVQSNSVTISVVVEGVGCPEFDFIDPVDGEEWNLSDDANEDIGDGFQHRVVISTSAGDSESVSLYLNDALEGVSTVDGTRIEYANLTFPTGGGAMTLRIQTTEDCFEEASVTIDETTP